MFTEVVNETLLSKVKLANVENDMHPNREDLSSSAVLISVFLRVLDYLSAGKFYQLKHTNT